MQCPKREKGEEKEEKDRQRRSVSLSESESESSYSLWDRGCQTSVPAVRDQATQTEEEPPQDTHYDEASKVQDTREGAQSSDAQKAVTSEGPVAAEGFNDAEQQLIIEQFLQATGSLGKDAMEEVKRAEFSLAEDEESVYEGEELVQMFDSLDVPAAPMHASFENASSGDLGKVWYSFRGTSCASMGGAPGLAKIPEKPVLRLRNQRLVRGAVALGDPGDCLDQLQCGHAQIFEKGCDSEESEKSLCGAKFQSVEKDTAQFEPAESGGDEKGWHLTLPDCSKDQLTCSDCAVSEKVFTDGTVVQESIPASVEASVMDEAEGMGKECATVMDEADQKARSSVSELLFAEKKSLAQKKKKKEKAWNIPASAEASVMDEADGMGTECATVMDEAVTEVSAHSSDAELLQSEHKSLAQKMKDKTRILITLAQQAGLQEVRQQLNSYLEGLEPTAAHEVLAGPGSFHEKEVH